MDENIRKEKNAKNWVSGGGFVIHKQQKLSNLLDHKELQKGRK